MEIVEVTSWANLLEELFNKSWNPDIGRHRSPYVFRGLSDESYRLQTSLQRLGGQFDNLERHLLRNFRKYAHRDLVPMDSLWNWLSVAQHHGLPTRLLDWTYSPFIALHFATSNIERYDVDGVIWCVDFIKTHELLPKKFKNLLEDEGAHAFTIDLLDEAAKSLNEFDSIADSEIVLFFEPPSIDDRIVNQFALFSIISDSNIVFDEWLNKHSYLSRKLIIPASLKWEIRDKLDKSNITERVLFPGMEGLARWLRRHYSSKN